MKSPIGQITKIIFLLAVIFVGLSQILPLTVLSVEGNGEEENFLDFYSWGMHEYASGDNWLVYFSPDTYSETTGSDEEVETEDSDVDEEIETPIMLFFIFFILMLTVFPMSLVCILLGAYAFFRIDKKKSKTSLAAGIMLTVSVIFFTLFQISFSLLINSFQSSSSFRLNINWSVGYFLMIISMVLFYIGYYLQKNYVFAPAGYAAPGGYYQPMNNPPQSPQFQQNNFNPRYQQHQTSPPTDSNVMFCTECGRRIPGDSKVCPYCGYKLYKDQ